MPVRFTPSPHAVLLAAMLAALGAAAQPAHADVMRARVPATASDEEDSREPRKKDRERVDRGTEMASPQAVGDAPVPPQGEPAPKPIITRGPLTIRRAEVSLGADHTISNRWVASGLLGVSRGRLHRFQTSIPPDAAPGGLPETSDSVIRTRSTSLTGMLTYMPGGDVFYDATLSVTRTRFEVQRVVNDLVLFEGRNAGRGWSLGLNAARLWRQGTRTVVPQLGIEYTRASVDPLTTQETFLSDGTRDAGFSVSRQRSRTLAVLAGVQVQWPRGANFGVWVPYTRATLRQRLWMRADTIVSTALGADPVLTEAQDITPRTAGALAAGLLVQWPRGVGAFAELGAMRANGDVRETRFNTGLKFEF